MKKVKMESFCDENASLLLFPRWLDCSGEGAFFNNVSGTPFNLVFTGTPHVPVLPAALPCGYGHTNVLSRQTNGIGTYENITGLAPQEGAQVQRWTGSSFAVYTFSNSAWL